MIFSEHLFFYISSSVLNLILNALSNVVIVSFLALNLSVIKCSVHIGDNNATLSKSVALDGRLFFDGSYFVIYKL